MFGMFKSLAHKEQNIFTPQACNSNSPEDGELPGAEGKTNSNLLQEWLTATDEWDTYVSKGLLYFAFSDCFWL